MYVCVAGVGGSLSVLLGWVLFLFFFRFFIYTYFHVHIYGLQKVILDRSVGKLGLSIIGGSEHASRVFGGGRPGVYVSKVSLMLPGPHTHAYICNVF